MWHHTISTHRMSHTIDVGVAVAAAAILSHCNQFWTGCIVSSSYFWLLLSFWRRIFSNRSRLYQLFASTCFCFCLLNFSMIFTCIRRNSKLSHIGTVLQVNVMRWNNIGSVDFVATQKNNKYFVCVNKFRQIENWMRSKPKSIKWFHFSILLSANDLRICRMSL